MKSLNHIFTRLGQITSPGTWSRFFSGRAGVFIAVVFFSALSFFAHAQIITTVAGGGTAGLGDGGNAVDAVIAQPIGVAVDAAGNVYIGDRDDNRIRKVSISGIITTIAGMGTPGYSGDGGNATTAKLNEPYGVAVDNAGNVYFADNLNCCIRKINTSGIISTIAGIGTGGYSGDNGPATIAKLSGPTGVAVDTIGNVYIADNGNNRIRKVDVSGIITTIAGTGTVGDSGDNGLAAMAELKSPYTVILDNAGNIYVCGDNDNRVRKINTSGIITTIAGTGTAGFSGDNGPATLAELDRSLGLAIDEAGNLYISDANNNRIRKVDPFGTITTYAGNGLGGYNGDNITALSAELFNPVDLALDGAGNLYISDFQNNRIRHITSTVYVPIVNNSSYNLTTYPNPSNGSFTFNLLSNVDEQAQVVIANITGEKIKELTTTTNTSINIQLKVPNGIYFLTAITTQGRWATKLMIEQ